MNTTAKIMSFLLIGFWAVMMVFITYDAHDTFAEIERITEQHEKNDGY